MFNKKKKKIEVLNQLLAIKEDIISNRNSKIEFLETKKEELGIVNDKFAKVIDKQAGEISELKNKIKKLEACFKPQVTNCEEEIVKPKKTPKKTSKTVKKA